MAGKKAKCKKTKPERLKPLSFYPLKAEEALRLFMQVKPEDIGMKTRGKRRPKS